MAIIKNTVGFTKASLVTKNGAEVFANSTGDGEFFVSFDGYEDDLSGYYFDEPAAREAAEFFLELAKELKRRSEED